MVVDSTYTKPDEQYPLLMVSGAGDAAVRDPPPVFDSLLWSSTVAPRRPWSERWPEYLSTCWMTVILLGISFLVFYAVGIVVIYRHEGYILVKCNETKPASEVFYHTIIPRGGAFPFSKYAEYLADVATMYPNLRFYVYFLIDDSKSLETHLLQNMYSPYSLIFYDEYNSYNKREIRCFQNKYSNVNITVMTLSKYMTMTPLKYRWRSIPTAYIPFYARIFAVWLNGGVGLDLVTYNQQYHSSNPLRIDRKVREILKQHNDGIVPDKYMETLNKFVREEETKLVSSFINMIQKVFNDTFSIFNRTFSSVSPTDTTSENSMGPVIPVFSETKSLIRTHRSKRDMPVTKEENETITDETTSHLATINIILGNATVVNEMDDSNKQYIYKIPANEPNLNSEVKTTKSDLKDNNIETLNEKIKKPELNQETEKNKSDIPQIVLLYDFSVISEPIGSDIYKRKNFTGPLKLVTVEGEGSFIASTSRMHTYLGTVLSAGCKRLPPKFAIQNALLTRCSGLFRDDNYCNSIFVL